MTAKQNQIQYDTEQRQKDLEYFSGAIEGLYGDPAQYDALIAQLQASNDPNKEYKIMLANKAKQTLNDKIAEQQAELYKQYLEQQAALAAQKKSSGGSGGGGKSSKKSGGSSKSSSSGSSSSSKLGNGGVTVESIAKSAKTMGADQKRGQNMTEYYKKYYK